MQFLRDALNPLPQPGVGQTTFDFIPANQLNMTEDDVPGQPLREDGKNTT